jgi:hypothetical protein
MHAERQWKLGDASLAWTFTPRVHVSAQLSPSVYNALCAAAYLSLLGITDSRAWKRESGSLRLPKKLLNFVCEPLEALALCPVVTETIGVIVQPNLARSMLGLLRNGAKLGS